MGKPKGMLESEIRIAMLLLEQRPPRYAGAGRKQCHRGRVRSERPTERIPFLSSFPTLSMMISAFFFSRRVNLSGQ